MDTKLYDCPVLIALRVLSGKWKTRVLWLLRSRAHHFGELKSLLPGVSAKVLAEQLRQLEGDGLVAKSIELRKGVSHSLYSYTDYGRSLIPALDQLGDWGLAHAAHQGEGPPGE